MMEAQFPARRLSPRTGDTAHNVRRGEVGTVAIKDF